VAACRRWAKSKDHVEARGQGSSQELVHTSKSSPAGAGLKVLPTEVPFRTPGGRVETLKILRAFPAHGKPTVDRAEAAAAGAFVAGVLHHPLGTSGMEQLQYNLLYRWLVGLGVDDPTLGIYTTQTAFSPISAVCPA
jgi:hypothetical protein